MKQNEGYKTLAAAVLASAMKDLKDAKKLLLVNPDCDKADVELDEIAEFLDSDWAITLDTLAGLKTLEKMKEELYDK